MGFDSAHARASALAVRGDLERASRLYRRLERAALDRRRKALIANDLAAIAATGGDLPAARRGVAGALLMDPRCAAAAANHRTLTGFAAPAPVPPAPPATIAPANRRTRVAVLSFLFNWPATGGGNVHTVELCRFLSRAGYDVAHFYPRYPAWGIGAVTEPTGVGGAALPFDDARWNVPAIQSAFRDAVAGFGPDRVIITDSWNFKPLLAEAIRGRPYLLRQQALECLCPLNNLRFLPRPDGTATQCPLHQLATPDACRRCLDERGQLSGGLHRLERALSGVGTAEYDAKLRRALAEAQAVLALNPLIAEMLSPWCRSVRVVTWGMDPARFPWPFPDDPAAPAGPAGVTRLLFAGLVPEMIKGFHVLREACALLWEKRRDFELLATADPVGRPDAFTRFVGWRGQDELPRVIRSADVLVMPTIAQEGLGRTTVEAMAAGRPVVASRIGGLPYTVADGATGLLCEPGDPADLALKIQTLLDDPALRRRMGLAGRRRFEQEFTWPTVIERDYGPLLGGPVAGR